MTHQLPLQNPRRQLHGSALIIVLAFLVLLCASVVIFLGMTTGARRSAKLIADNDQARQLARLAADQVVSKLTLATTGTNPGTAAAPNGNNAETWVSQPGMVRLFNADGTLKTAYKLYSAENLELNGASINTSQKLLDAVKADAPNNWATKGLTYVDINAPSSDGRYPVLAPPSSTAGEDPEGFAAPNGVTMPVRWWYLQKDGTLQSAPGANPVGRIAWWADDETCKLNINTASEGAYASNRYSYSDKSTWSIPGVHEYNMAAGHPATTSLSVVFGGWMKKANPAVTDQDIAAYLVNASPHVKWGGTLASTNSSISNYKGVTEGFTPTIRGDAPFYSSLDDYHYANSQPGTDGIRTPSSLISREAIEKAKFFATARSSGANLNPFGRPRISIWPIPNLVTQRSNFDKKMVAASQYAGKDYFFARNNPTTAGGSNGGALSDAADIDLARNDELYTFMLNQTKATIAKGESPDNLSSKYTAVEWQQILTLIFEYIRCTNIVDLSPTPSVSSPYVTNTDAPGVQATQTPAIKTSGMIIPTKKQGTQTFRAFGRAPVVSEVSVHLFATKKTATEIEIAAALYFEPVIPEVGTPPVYPYVNYEVSSFTFRLKGKNTEKTFTISGSNVVRPHSWGGLSLWSGGSLGIGPTIFNTIDFFAADLVKNPNLLTYPFFTSSQIFQISDLLEDGNLGKMDFLPGPLQFEIKTGDGITTLQTYNLEFPATAIPTPTLPTGPTGVAEMSFQKRVMDYRANKAIVAAAEPAPTLFQEGDVVRSLELKDGDLRILACAETVNKGFFAPHLYYYESSKYQAHSLRHKANAQFGLEAKTGVNSGSGYSYSDVPISIAPVNVRWFQDFNPAQNYLYIEENLVSGGYRYQHRKDMFDVMQQFDLPSNFETGFGGADGGNGTKWARDFESGPQTAHRWDEPGMIQDGPWISKSWEANGCVGLKVPDAETQEKSRPLFSPYMQVPSPVIFGTLPTGAFRTIKAYNASGTAYPWQTLLFCPNPLGPITGEHPGKGSPKDYRLLDFFQMPVVEPYAITTQGSTYGQVNMNQQIIPFTDITRTTGFRGILKGVRMHAIPDAIGTTYKDKDDAETGSNRIILDIDRDRTVTGWAKRFDQGDVYRFPSEICDIYMVPSIGTGVPYSNFPTQPEADEASMKAWWAKCRMTGKNLREMPYARLYPRLTTQSNTYRVHVIAQTLSPNFAARATDANGGKDQVTGEWRGSMQVERYLDKDKIAGINPDNQSLQGSYSFQVGGAETFR